MNSRHENVSLNVAQSSAHKRRKKVLTTLAWLALAPLLTNCGTSSAPGPPKNSPTDAWLSFKVSHNCGAYASCTGLKDFDDTNGLSEASKYYCSLGIAPTDCANNVAPQYLFSKWKSDNGFPATGHPPAHAFYANKGDLQLGRDMNCMQNGQNVACYVTNYGQPPFDAVNKVPNPAWPDLDGAVVDAFYQNNPFATVAMVYNPNGFPNGDKVAFYVFANNGKPAEGALVNNAALDTDGPKSVPRMCMACHGGTYNQNTAAAAPFNSSAPGINFLFFDIYFFHYVEGMDITPDLPAVQEGFRQLNYLVSLTHPNPMPGNADSAILQAINDEYPNGFSTPGNTAPADPPVPTGWTSQPHLYTTVFRPYCRSCHLAESNFTFSNVSDFASDATLIQSFVCTGNHDMPHAQVPFGLQSSSTTYGLWWDVQALTDLTSFLKGQPGKNAGCP
jgi:hypothetical protein